MSWLAVWLFRCMLAMLVWKYPNPHNIRLKIGNGAFVYPDIFSCMLNDGNKVRRLDKRKSKYIVWIIGLTYYYSMK